jgi:hypothetical protein
MRSRSFSAFLAAAVVAGAFLPGCTRGRSPRTAWGEGVPLSETTPPPPSQQRTPGAPGTVSLSDADLAPVDAYVARRQWIVADEVEVIASREYFAQALMVASSVGRVRQDESQEATGATVTLTFVGQPDEVDVTTAPRVMIGTGLNVSARKRIRIHLTKTVDAGMPVRLQVTARGLASTGVADRVDRKADQIVLGGVLARAPEGGYRFQEISR